ncbi:hypothetical protein [Streptomyces albicerus]|uniref:hypothetical protein n=1 Tax=Streptomyces albicerus TaxID=2569859 RepID=UPI00124BB237|nr:hypothetical protein [Streptomyces albicerus]
MRTPHALRTALVATGVTATLGLSAALGLSASGALALSAPTTETVALASHGVAHSKAKRVYVKTVKLADKVSRAKVYKTGKNRYQAEISAKGVKYGTLVAAGKAAYGQNNGLHVTLQPTGKVTSWVEKAKPKPKPKPVVKRTLVASATLADNTSTAKVYKLSAGHYEADVYTGGTKIDTLVAKGSAAYGENNGLHVTLQPDGQLTSWVEDTPAPDPDAASQPDNTDQPNPGTSDASDNATPDIQHSGDLQAPVAPGSPA